MSLEPLGSFIRQPSQGNSFHRIYRAHLLQGKLVDLLGAGVTVSMRGSQVKLWCDNSQLVSLAHLKKTKILAVCHQTLGQAQLKLSIKLKVSGEQ